jgi:hypothetical protein
MDPQDQAMLFNLMKAGKFSDFSSATMDPVLSLIMGTYQPQPKFDEAQLWERYAPNTMLAAQGDPKDPYVVAASQIRAGSPPWSLYDMAPKNVKPTAWNKFIDSIAAEQQTVKSKIMEQGLEQDPFQKQGLPGYGEKFKLEDLTKYAPKDFENIYQGFDEATAKEAKLRSNVVDQYRNPISYATEKDKLAYLMQVQKDNSARNKREEEKLGVLPSFAKAFGKTARVLPLAAYPILGLLNNIPGFSDKVYGPGGNPADLQSTREKQRAKAALKEMGNAPIIREDPTQRRNLYADYLDSMIARRSDTASGKAARAQTLGTEIERQLTEQGKTPLTEALKLALIYKNMAKRGTA